MTITSASVVIDENGISAPTFSEIQDWLKEQYRGIYGTDVYLESDSQDGQFIGILARCISDANAAAMLVYSSFSPATAKGDALSRNVKLNGIARAVATNSTATVILIGVAGTTIANGIISDASGNRWMLPASVTISNTGSVSVTATAEFAGAVIAPAGSINKISTPTRGWQSVSNASAAITGAPVETNAQLRQRQALSVALPSRALIDGIVGAVKSLDGVSRCRGYENTTDEIDANGLPRHSIGLVVVGGDSTEIAETIFHKKSPGCGIAGDIIVNITDDYGNPVISRYFSTDNKTAVVSITLQVMSSYSTEIGNKIKQSIADYINTQIDIGGRISMTKLYVAAGLYGAADSVSYEVLSMTIDIGDGPTSSDIQLEFRQLVSCSTSDISIGVT